MVLWPSYSDLDLEFIDIDRNYKSRCMYIRMISTHTCNFYIWWMEHRHFQSYSSQHPTMANTRDKPLTFEFDGYSSVNRLVLFGHGEERAVTWFMKLSPDGKMLALGDNSGYLEVRLYYCNLLLSLPIFT